MVPASRVYRGGTPRRRGTGGDSEGAGESGGNDGAGRAWAGASELDGDPGTYHHFFFLEYLFFFCLFFTFRTRLFFFFFPSHFFFWVCFFCVCVSFLVFFFCIFLMFLLFLLRPVLRTYSIRVRIFRRVGVFMRIHACVCCQSVCLVS